MLNGLTYQKKLKLLAPVAIVAIFFVYFLGIKKTLAIRSDINEKKEKLALAKDLNGKVSLIRTKLKHIDELVGNDMDSSKKVIDVILEDITNYCNTQGCIIREIPEVHTASDANFNIETYLITVEGHYKQLLNLVYLLEQKKKNGGRLSSCKFYSRKNNATKKLSLEATLYIQQYDKKQNAN
jgi:hypothetical protein